MNYGDCERFGCTNTNCQQTVGAEFRYTLCDDCLEEFEELARGMSQMMGRRYATSNFWSKLLISFRESEKTPTAYDATSFTRWLKYNTTRRNT